MLKSNIFFGLIFTSLILLIGCADIELQEQYDGAAQRAIDRIIIQKYIEDNELGTPDTTISGASFFILNEGEGDSIKVGDFVFLETAEYDTDTTNVNTNIKISIPAVPEILRDTIFRSRIEAVDPAVFTYSQSGWTLEFIYPIAASDQQLLSFNNKWLGFKEAILASFPRMKVGGHVLIILPSTEAYGPRRTIFPVNSVMVYKVYIVDSK